MLKDYVIIDNVLDNPYEVKKNMLEVPFYSAETYKIPGIKYATDNKPPLGDWRGFRSSELFNNYKAANILLKDAFSKAFELNYEYRGVSAYAHITVNKMNKEIEEGSRWHRDNNYIFAGVIYLGESPKYGSGTWLNIDGKLVHITNKFNRLVLYKSNILHRPGRFFGSTASNSRLTLTFFISGVLFKPWFTMTSTGIKKDYV